MAARTALSRTRVASTCLGLFVMFGSAACSSAPRPALLDLDCPPGAEASIRGRVVTARGDAIVGARVTFVPGTDYTSEVGTDETGGFQVNCIPPGDGYELRVETPGFRSHRRTGIRAKVPVLNTCSVDGSSMVASCCVARKMIRSCLRACTIALTDGGRPILNRTTV